MLILRIFKNTPISNIIKITISYGDGKWLPTKPIKNKQEVIK